MSSKITWGEWERPLGALILSNWPITLPVPHSKGVLNV